MTKTIKPLYEVFNFNRALLLVVCVAGTLLDMNEFDISVFDGMRTFKEQKKLVRSGRSWTLASKHLKGQAVDLVPYIDGRLSWDNMDAFKEIAAAMRRHATRHRIKIIWGAQKRYGGDWLTVNDAAHFELA